MAAGLDGKIFGTWRLSHVSCESWRTSDNAPEAHGPHPDRSTSVAVGFSESDLGGGLHLTGEVHKLRRQPTSLLSSLFRSLSDVSDDAPLQVRDEDRCSRPALDETAECVDRYSMPHSRPIPIPTTTYFRDPRHIEERAKLHQARAKYYRSKSNEEAL